MDWKKEPIVASHWLSKPELSKVECTLCPRHCTLKEGQDGFCRVRGNREDQLLSFNYGKAIPATIETIETEAIYHYAPGARILSMGNIGCMMACSFCQNWQTSQIKHLDNKNVVVYTPQEVVDLALKNDIGIISWTYNDPVVWQEFVMDTSRLAKKHGIKTLYKSALYIETKPLAELIEVIDIFSISLKSMSDEMYKKISKARLEPVLKGIKQIYDSGKHLEVSQLVVTDLNDDGEDALKTAQWMVNNLDSSIPLHFVGYHPAFRYKAARTPLKALLKAREIAMAQGIQYCYLGNVYDDSVSNTHCTSCEQKLVERFGLTIDVMGLNENSNCTKCNTSSPIANPLDGAITKEIDTESYQEKQHFDLEWNAEMNALHLVVEDTVKEAVMLKVERFPSGKTDFFELSIGLERIILTKSEGDESRIRLGANTESKLHCLPVLDRAHFPTIETNPENKKYLN